MKGLSRAVRSVGQAWPRYATIVTRVVFVMVVLVQGAFHQLTIAEGRPYESWDEIAGFNNAHVLVGAAADRTYRYGSMDTFLQWAAIVGYQHFSVIGASHEHLRYANAVPQSWDDPLVSWRQKTWSGVDYNYFRGVDDRNPIFISRQIHFAFAYLIVLALGLGCIGIFGPRAVFVLISLVLLTVDPVVYRQTFHSLPNAINALLSFAIVLFAMLFADQVLDRYLMLASACFAVALNFKPDVLVVGSAIGLAMGLCLIHRGMKAALVSGARATLTFGAAFVATNPGFLFAPGHALRITYATIFYQVAAGPSSDGYVSANIRFLSETLDRALLWESAGVGLPLAIAVILCCLLTATLRRTPASTVLAVGGGTSLLAWGAIVFRVHNPFDRYWLNGLGAFLATVAMALVVAERGEWRRSVRAILAVAAMVYCAHATVGAQRGFATYVTYRASGGFSPLHQRTQASLFAIQTAKQPGYSSTVLVDQHAYVDLLPFRLADVDARYINMLSLESVVASLSPGRRYVVVFGKGDYTPEQGEWSPPLTQAYDAYQSKLARYPVLRHYAGRPQRLLSAFPMADSLDVEMTVAVLSDPYRDQMPSASVEVGVPNDGLWHPLTYRMVNDANQPSFEEAFASTNGYRLFVQNGMAAFRPFPSSSSRVDIRVNAAGVLGGGRYPVLVVEVRRIGDEKYARRYSLRLIGDRHDYDVAFDPPAKGLYEVRLVFEDDFYSEGQGDRNVRLYSVSARTGPERKR